MKLYSYWRSSAAYRVRIALNLKGIEADYIAVNLLEGAHKAPAYLARNPAGLVPTLELDDGQCLTQSLAIIDYLESLRPEPALLPAEPLERARVQSMAYTVACEIHPLNNMGVLNYLKAEYDADPPRLNDWMYQWLDRGFGSLEQQIAAQPYAHGTSVTLADVLLIPMCYNALRFEYPLKEKHPKVHAVWETCNTLPAFAAARPEEQPDAV
jgi:maleylpyruvate isomerase